jgi:hypothetical protein
MAEAIKKKSVVKPDEKATMLAKTEKLKAVAVKEPSEVQTVPGPEEKAIQAKPTKPEGQPAKTPETPKAETETDAKKEADPSKEFVDGIMVEMALKGAPKKRLIKTLVGQYGMDKQRVMFKLKRALITERYAAAHAEAGH